MKKNEKAKRINKDSEAYKLIRIVIKAILSVFTAVAFLNDFETMQSVYTFIMPVMVVFSFIFYSFLEKKELKMTAPILITAGITAAFFLLGKTYSVEYSSVLLFGSKMRLLVSLISFIGLTAFFTKLYILVMLAFEKLEAGNVNVKAMTGPKILEKIFGGKASFFKVAAIILITWLPMLITCYPGTVNADANFELYQALGRYNYADPVLHTLYLWVFVQLGNAIGSFDTGIYISMLVQTLIMISVMSYSIKVLYRKGVNRFYLLFILAIYCFSPMFWNIATTTIKDTLFDTFILLYIICLYDFISADEIKISVKSALKVLIPPVIAMLLRSNGSLIVFGASLALVIFLAKTKKLNIKKKLLSILIYAILPIALYAGIKSALAVSLNVVQMNGKEFLCLPFQQTARYVRDYSDDVTDEEWEVLEKIIIEPEKLGDIYHPNIADPIKRAYNNEATTADDLEYLGIWFTMSFKHPDAYLEAFFCHIYGWFDLGVRNNIRYTVDSELFTTPSQGGTAELMQNWYNTAAKNPVVGIFDNIPFYVWWMFLIIAYMNKKKQSDKKQSDNNQSENKQSEKKWWFVLVMPLLFTLLGCILSPCCLQHPRYGYPISFAVPFLAGAIIGSVGEKTVQKKENSAE